MTTIPAEFEIEAPDDTVKSTWSHFLELLAELNDIRTFELCATITLVLLCFYAGTSWYLRVPMKSVTLCAIFLPRLRRSSTWWLLITALMASANLYDRLLIDNHKYLMTYWCFAVYVASLQNDLSERDRVLAFNAQVLLGLCFAAAVVAKLLSPDYFDGRFFHYTLLTDGRFSNFTWLSGGIHHSTLAEMKSMLRDSQNSYLFAADEHQVPLVLVSSSRLQHVVQFMTWWTIAIESAIALAFIFPGRNRLLDWCRRYLLWIFLFSTYSVALVSGFAWLIATMGLAQLPKDRGQYRIVYIFIMAVALQLYEVRIISLIRELFDYVLPGAGSP